MTKQEMEEIQKYMQENFEDKEYIRVLFLYIGHQLVQLERRLEKVEAPASAPTKDDSDWRNQIAAANRYAELEYERGVGNGKSYNQRRIKDLLEENTKLQAQVNTLEKVIAGHSTELHE
jgi:hypothetical protein